MKRILSGLEFFERIIVLVLIGLMVLTISAATFELGASLLKDLIKSQNMILATSELLDIFGLFLLVLLGLELLETIKAYLIEHAVHVEVVMMVALIAIARKVVVLDLKEIDSLTLFGIGFIMLCLAIAYFLISRVFQERGKNAPH